MIEPLPNLDYKVVQGNSLLDIDRNIFNNDLFDELEYLKPLFFNATVTEKKQEYDRRIKELIHQITNGSKDFDFKVHFSEAFREDQGFDVMIANPPYIKEYVNRSAFDRVRNSPYYKGKMDIWYMFACKGLDVLKRDGFLTFIAQNNWVTSDGASKMRNKVIKDSQIINLIDFGALKIFDAGIQTMVMIFQKNTEKNDYLFDYRRLLGKELNINDAVALLAQEKSKKTEYLTPKISRTTLIDKSLTFSALDVQQVLEKILSKSNFSLMEKEAANGIHHHHDRVDGERAKILRGGFRVGDGIFVLNNAEKQGIQFTSKELELVKPSYTTEELDRWHTNPINQEWVIYTDSSFKKDKHKIANYPNIRKHLDQFKKVITSDNKPYGLHRARDERFFKGEKIIAVRKCARPIFAYVDFDSYVSAAFYVIKTDRVNQKYLVGVLNSRLIEFWLRNKGKMQGTNYQVDKGPLMELPLVCPNAQKQKEIMVIVDKILSTIDTKQTQIREYEKDIDKLVYDLYDLTPDEIKIIEEGNNPK